MDGVKLGSYLNVLRQVLRQVLRCVETYVETGSETGVDTGELVEARLRRWYFFPLFFSAVSCLKTG